MNLSKAASVGGLFHFQRSTQCLLSARTGPTEPVWRFPLFGVDRKWPDHGKNDAIDPDRASRCSQYKCTTNKYATRPRRTSNWLMVALNGCLTKSDLHAQSGDHSLDQ